jgi:lipoprotein-anchoring transpeptidase ErfK/SrfK
MKRQVRVAVVIAVVSASICGVERPIAAQVAPAESDRILAVQVLLDRARFSPGEIDGTAGKNTTRAIEGFERATGGSVSDALATAGPPTVSYTIGDEDGSGPFLASVPDDMMEKAKLPHLGYTSVLEMLAERFHAAPELLRRLNPSATFTAGESIVVPNVIVATISGPAAAPPASAVTVTVSKSRSVLVVADSTGAIVYQAPATTGSEHDPLPIGEWKVTGVARNPKFHYNPDLFWDADPSHAKATIPAGPNGPVGVVWIDLDKPHYGIHGTPEPGTVGHTSSHGCVRLTNWDAVAVAGLVAKGTKVVFVE